MVIEKTVLYRESIKGNDTVKSELSDLEEYLGSIGNVTQMKKTKRDESNQFAGSHVISQHITELYELTFKDKKYSLNSHYDYFTDSISWDGCGRVGGHEGRINCVYSEDGTEPVLLISTKKMSYWDNNDFFEDPPSYNEFEITVHQRDKLFEDYYTDIITRIQTIKGKI